MPCRVRLGVHGTVELQPGIHDADEVPLAPLCRALDGGHGQPVGLRRLGASEANGWRRKTTGKRRISGWPPPHHTP
ncbi:MAG: hypothetical protein IT330_08310 [Anaerolineae bacterium]|nr:hypothetical protein [Anaerolineae bacterium]